MLLLTTIVSWAGWPERTGAVVINTHRLSGCRTVNTNDTMGLFSIRGGHQRGDLRAMQIDSTIAQVVTASDIVPTHALNAYSCYPDRDSAKVAVSQYFKTEDIVYAYADPTDANARSYMLVLENGIKLNKYLVANKLKNIVGLGNTGATSATSTTTAH